MERSVTDGRAIGCCEHCGETLAPADIAGGWCPVCRRHQRVVSEFYGRRRGRAPTRVDVVFPESIEQRVREANE